MRRASSTGIRTFSSSAVLAQPQFKHFKKCISIWDQNLLWSHDSESITISGTPLSGISSAPTTCLTTIIMQLQISDSRAILNSSNRVTFGISTSISLKTFCRRQRRCPTIKFCRTCSTKYCSHLKRKSWKSKSHTNSQQAKTKAISEERRCLTLNLSLERQSKRAWRGLSLLNKTGVHMVSEVAWTRPTLVVC